MTEFRKLFSSIKPPPYCQIAMPKGVIQDWGLVEFFDPRDSEDTQRVTNLTLFHGRRIRVHFCIPGVNAINIYMQVKLINLRGLFLHHLFPKQRRSQFSEKQANQSLVLKNS